MIPTFLNIFCCRMPVERNIDYRLHDRLPKVTTCDGLCSIMNNSVPKPGLTGFNDTDSLLFLRCRGYRETLLSPSSFVHLVAVRSPNEYWEIGR